ncbi:MAG: hypothetical protein EOQ27_15990 [Mesorhizobium sp.]|nr:hypothetical protein EOA31_11180 [Mesorhizobium sp. M4B.F.Ca.ET.049.02.1.2]RWA62183.1 MAG: hypothetical protein EOQ27_15990 [Mesorhizobium sp.]TGV26483.1 hypothetical protein EN786_13305 [Mesorhizobium sp. M4B.F.Ca.ET.143.01.1.1]
MQRDISEAPRPSAGCLRCLLSPRHCLMSRPGEGANMNLKNRSRIFWGAAVLLLISTAASAEEWWKDSFAAEGSAPCDNNDTIVTFTDKAVEMWEVGCSLEKVQKIGGLDAIILDMTCSDGETTEKRRELLLKLEDNKVMRYPRQEVLQRCSELKAQPGPDPKVETAH